MKTITHPDHHIIHGPLPSRTPSQINTILSAAETYGRFLIGSDLRNPEGMRFAGVISARETGNVMGRTVWNWNAGMILIQVTDRLLRYGPDEEIHDTIRHEFAHVMAGYVADHDVDWRLWARKLGANPDGSNYAMPRKYEARCCGTAYGLMRLRKNVSYSCSACDMPLRNMFQRW